MLYIWYTTALLKVGEMEEFILGLNRLSRKTANDCCSIVRIWASLEFAPYSVLLVGQTYLKRKYNCWSNVRILRRPHELDNPKLRCFICGWQEIDWEALCTAPRLEKISLFVSILSKFDANLTSLLCQNVIAKSVFFNMGLTPAPPFEQY